MLLRVFMVVFALAASLAQAEGTSREVVGWGRHFTNDFFGDTEDRWQSGSYSLSVLTARQGAVDAARPLDLIEYRLRSQIIAPRRLNGAGSFDRLYAGVLSFGAHTHFDYGETDFVLGADMVVTGPQTGIADMQDWFHQLIDAPYLHPNVVANQIENAVYPTAVAEMGRSIRITPTVRLRPFIEAQAGVEDFARVGWDLAIGETGLDLRRARDGVTGFRYNLGESDVSGVAWAFGADFTQVYDSAFFPSRHPAELERDRLRVRGGMHWQVARNMSLFYGLTYLSEEYVGQEEGQIVGSLKLNFAY